MKEREKEAEDLSVSLEERIEKLLEENKVCIFLYILSQKRIYIMKV